MSDAAGPFQKLSEDVSCWVRSPGWREFRFALILTTCVYRNVKGCFLTHDCPDGSVPFATLYGLEATQACDHADCLGQSWCDDSGNCSHAAAGSGAHGRKSEWGIKTREVPLHLMQPPNPAKCTPRIRIALDEYQLGVLHPTFVSFLPGKKEMHVSQQRPKSPTASIVLKGFDTSVQAMSLHRMGSITPYPGFPPQFAQLYIHDNSKLQNQLQFNKYSNPRDPNYGERTESERNIRHRAIMETMTRVISRYNPFAKLFKNAGERMRADQTHIYGMKIIAKRDKDPRTHNAPTIDGIAAIIPDRDVIVKMRNVDETGKPTFHQVSILHPSYYPLAYPLLFLLGTRVSAGLSTREEGDACIPASPKAANRVHFIDGSRCENALRSSVLRFSDIILLQCQRVRLSMPPTQVSRSPSKEDAKGSGDFGAKSESPHTSQDSAPPRVEPEYLSLGEGGAPCRIFSPEYSSLSFSANDNIFLSPPTSSPEKHRWIGAVECSSKESHWELVSGSSSRTGTASGLPVELEDSPSLDSSTDVEDDFGPSYESSSSAAVVDVGADFGSVEKAAQPVLSLSEPSSPSSDVVATASAAEPGCTLEDPGDSAATDKDHTVRVGSQPGGFADHHGKISDSPQRRARSRSTRICSPPQASYRQLWHAASTKVIENFIDGSSHRHK
ncbi:hypothetical protein B0O80DRAFT_504626 [Mortierella sp. GBAus27b]|nr:hypothetical protein B0O80DRAFT_504626 [Mortierella sp. GBAus27b]